MLPDAAQVSGIATGVRCGLSGDVAQPHMATAGKVIQAHSITGNIEFRYL
jgi:hypothetical protein